MIHSLDSLHLSHFRRRAGSPEKRPAFSYLPMISERLAVFRDHALAGPQGR